MVLLSGLAAPGTGPRGGWEARPRLTLETSTVMRACKFTVSVSWGFLFFLGLVAESLLAIIRDGILTLLRR